MKEKYKVLVITDSLGLPRLAPERVTYEETYFAKLEVKYPDWKLVPMMYGGADLPTLYHHAAFYYKSIRPAKIIIQSGIVDCAPRAFTRIEYKMINSVGIIKSLYNSRFKSTIKKAAKARGLTSTSEQDFELFARKMLEAFPEASIYWNGILPASEGYEKLLPGVTKNIIRYNNIIGNVIGNGYIDHSDFSTKGIMSDYHHLNAFGHDAIFNKLIKTNIF
jgi:hypothetical protein